MLKYFPATIVILFTTIMLGCKGYSKYPIDEKPLVKTDSAFYGIWKAVEDTDKDSYILVQSPYDIYHHTDWWYHLDSASRRPYFDAQLLADPERAKMAFYKNDAELKEAYESFVEKKDHYYYLTRMGDHGKKTQYEQWSVFLSRVENATFLNIPYRYVPEKNGHLNGSIQKGYFFVRLIGINTAYDTITTAVVADSTMRYLASSKEVRNKIAKNVNDPAFYSDTLHFYKVSGKHLSMGETVKR